MNNKITKREAFDYLKKLTLPNVSSYFLASGMVLILTATPGTLEQLIVLTAILSGKDTTTPEATFGWLPASGFLLLAIGGVIKLKHHYTSLNKKLRAKRTWLKENFKTLSDDKLQDMFEELWFIKNISFRAIKHLLGHDDNKNAVLSLFNKCHKNVLANKDWFEFKGKYLKSRYRFGLAISMPSFALMLLLGLTLCLIEHLNPGSTNSGPYAFWGYCAYCIFSILGGYIVYKEFQSLGHAITLVEEHAPKNHL